MSQVGYMIVGVSIGAYGGGLFHLMTHAFFKALLFMGAGSVIAAMANIQNIDEMGGFRKSMPFTFVLMTIGALALAAFTGTSGFFSKDEILGYAAERGGCTGPLRSAATSAAFLTAFYSFRIVFRVFYGEPVRGGQGARGSGHLAHGEPVNPHTGEPEDTDVGFPGAEHHIAERTWPMRIGMAVLGFGALFAGYIQVPGVDAVLEHLFEPVFEASPLYTITPSVGRLLHRAARSAACSASSASRSPTTSTSSRRAPPPGSARASAGLHKLLVNKYYFDEIQDALILRPVLAVGRFANDVFERYVVQGIVVFFRDGAGGLGDAVKAAQSGFVRSYAAARDRRLRRPRPLLPDRGELMGEVSDRC